MARPLNPDLELFERGVFARLSSVDAGYGPATVLVGVDFEIRTGEVAIITGPAAAGKTTLTHLLRLALTPRAGRAVILGVDIATASGSMRARAKRRIGYVGENPVFIEHWSAFDNIAMPLKLIGMKPAEYAHDVRELVDFVGLGGASDLAVEKFRARNDAGPPLRARSPASPTSSWPTTQPPACRQATGGALCACSVRCAASAPLS